MSRAAGHKSYWSHQSHVTFLLALGLLCVPARAEWWDTLTTQKGAFAPLRPLQAHYRFGWTMFSAAEADFVLAREAGDLTRLTVTTQTIGAVRASWKMNSEAVSTMMTPTLRPIALRQKEVYRKGTKKTRLDFTDSEVLRLRESTPAKDPAKTKKFEFPNIYDLHSAFHFFRSQRLADGDVYSLVVYPSADPYLARVSVQGHPQMKVAGSQQKVIKLDLKLWKINDADYTLKTHEKFKRATIYLADDANRMLLRIEGEVAVGSVWCELDKLAFTKP